MNKLCEIPAVFEQFLNKKQTIRGFHQFIHDRMLKSFPFIKHMTRLSQTTAKIPKIV